MYSLQPAHTARESCLMTWLEYCFEMCIKQCSSTDMLDDSVCNYHEQSFKQIGGEVKCKVIAWEASCIAEMSEKKTNLQTGLIMKFKIQPSKS